MKLVNFYRKPISVLVMVTFTVLLCFWTNQAPATPAPEKSSAAALENSKGESTGFIEQEEPERAYKKGKKFPWLLVGVVVVIGAAAAYYFLVVNKKYTLTVTVGEGVSGTPAAGTSTYKKGTVVNYNYTLQSGYNNLSVTLDGVAADASGTVTMNANHALAASATKTFVLTVSRGEHVTGTPSSGAFTYARGTNVPYSYAPASGYSNLEVKIDNVAAANAGSIAMDTNHTLTANLQGANIVVNSTPAGARIYLDNVDSGFSTPHAFFFATAVTKNVYLRYSCGYKEHSENVSVALGQTKTINATLVPGIWEEFLIPASSCWLPNNPSVWTTIPQLYRYLGSATNFDANVYNYSFGGNYSVKIHMNRKTGTTNNSNSIFLGTGTNMNNASGYLFQYTCDGRYSIYRAANFNFIAASGSITALRPWANTPTIIQGLNKFNIMKVVKTGSNYGYYINNVLVTSIVDATYNPGYCALVLWANGVHTEIQYNYVILTLGGSAPASVPFPPLNAAPPTGKEQYEVGGRI